MSPDRSPAGSTVSAWGVEVRRAVLSWRALVIGTCLGAYIAVQVDGLGGTSQLVTGAQGALSLAGSQGGLPPLVVALVAGLFAAFGLVEDLTFGRAPYARVRCGGSAHSRIRSVGPAIGAAAAVTLAGAIAMAFAFVRFPNVAISPANDALVGPSNQLFVAVPLAGDIAWIGFVALVTATLTLLAAGTARMRRQLVTLLFPAAFVIVGNLTAQGPLAILNPVAHADPADHFGLAAALTYWLVLGGASLIWTVRSSRSGVERVDA